MLLYCRKLAQIPQTHVNNIAFQQRFFNLSGIILCGWNAFQPVLKVTTLSNYPVGMVLSNLVSDVHKCHFFYLLPILDYTEMIFSFVLRLSL